MPKINHNTNCPDWRLLLKLISRITLLLAFFNPDANSTHIVGGDMSYRCLGNNQYEITLTLRRDCINGNPGAQFDDPAHIGIFDSQGNLQSQLGDIGRLLMPYRNDDTLNEILVKTCGIEGGDVCVHTTQYVDTIELPFLKGGYTLAYQRCCRNFSIVNIISPLSTGATYSMEITEESLLQCNASPKLSPYPPIYICGGLPIDFNLKATDEDGDSLVYRMCYPLTGADQAVPRPTTPSNPPYAPVDFLPPYSLTDMIGGTPALGIDSKTGRMQGFAQAIIAQYLIAYCVEEYRNGKLLSVLRRDFQINVRLCNSSPKADFTSFYSPCDEPLQLSLLDQSNDPFSNISQWNWNFEFNGTPLSSKEQNPVLQFDSSGLLRIRLIVQSDGMCSDTIRKELNIHSIVPQFLSKNDSICRGDSTMLAGKFNLDAKYRWFPTSGLSCTSCPNPYFFPFQNTTYVLHTSDSSCSRTDTVHIFVDPCVVDSCAVSVQKTCLANGMIELKAVDAFGQTIIPKSRQHELFWNVSAGINHPAYALQDQNPILIFKNDAYSLTSKMYSWQANRPKSIEFAKICERRVAEQLDIECSGPCSELNFILSSCEDDYDLDNNLNFPPTVCQTICGGACNYIIALFEPNGELINPSHYKISWSDGSSGAYVMKMGPYFNNLRVRVEKGDCVWNGRYWKSCNGFSGNFTNGQQAEDYYTNGEELSEFTLRQAKSENFIYVYKLDGRLIAAGMASQVWNNLPTGNYLVLVPESADVKGKILFKAP